MERESPTLKYGKERNICARLVKKRTMENYSSFNEKKYVAIKGSGMC